MDARVSAVLLHADTLVETVQMTVGVDVEAELERLCLGTVEGLALCKSYISTAHSYTSARTRVDYLG